MTNPDQLCNVCQDPDAPTYEAGGLWWCEGCADEITAEHVEADLAEMAARPRSSAARAADSIAIIAAVERTEPATVMDVLRALDRDWSQRTTVRLGLYALVDDGVLICDEERPMRFAINQLRDQGPDIHPWVRLCELASCSPDFDVVYGLDRRQACDWLAGRLEAHNLTVYMPKIEAAYDSWPPKADADTNRAEGGA